jgi:hypothetical protein
MNIKRKELKEFALPKGLILKGERFVVLGLAQPSSLLPQGKKQARKRKAGAGLPHSKCSYLQN